MAAVDKTMTIATTAAGIHQGGTNGVIRAVRSAESNRVASCLFADRIAQLSIAEYKSQCSSDIQDSYKQTVLAAFFIQRSYTEKSAVVSKPMKYHHDMMIASTLDEESLEIVSFGVGTKVLSQEKILDEFHFSQGEGEGSEFM